MSAADALSVLDGSMTDPEVARWVAELVERHQKGEALEIEAYLRAYPERAERIRPYLSMIERLAELGSPASPQVGRADPAETAMAARLAAASGYRVVRRVGWGGMGAVYEAEEVGHSRRVALKFLHPVAAIDPLYRKRFEREFQAASSLHHTHIVPLYDHGLDAEVPYYAMRFIDGFSLARLIRELRTVEGPEPHDAIPEALAALLAGAEGVDSSSTVWQSPAYVRAVARIGMQAADALAHAHEQGVIHRDVKPSNLLLDRSGNVWVADFGLARVVGEPGLSLSGALMGTLRYMSPEQARGDRTQIDGRTDIYSLGATLYELLTLEPAVAGDDAPTLLARIAQGAARPIRERNPAVPADLEQVVLKALAKDRDNRYPLAQDLANDLRLVLDPPLNRKRPSSRQARPRWYRTIAALLSLTAVVAVITALVLPLMRPANPRGLIGTTYAVGKYPWGVVVGDFNKDGRSDLVVANHKAHELSVLLGRGDGSFCRASGHKTKRNTIDVAAGDFNGDGKLDIATLHCDAAELRVQLGQGDGTFHELGLCATGAKPYRIVAGDFDSDGVLDLATANYSGSVTVLLGLGNGEFGRIRSYQTHGFSRSLSIGDFNHDRKPDLVVVNNSGENNQGSLDILLGKGDGTFLDPARYDVGMGGVEVAVADFDGDKTLDLAVTFHEYHLVKVLLGKADGTFLPPESPPIPGRLPYAIVAGDFNRDGTPDIATANEGTNDVSVLLSDGNGNFEDDRSFPTRPGPLRIVTGDFNGDKYLDLAVTHGADNRVSVFLGAGDGTFR